MNKPMELRARPQGGWSLPHTSDATHALTALYREHIDRVTKGDLVLIARAVNGRVPDQMHPLDDGYEPFAQAEFRAGTGLGDILVVFPVDVARPVTVHTMDEVPDSIADRIVYRIAQSFAEKMRPATVKEVLEQL